MISLYQVLDYYKEKNIPVMTGLWQSTLDYNDNVPFYTTIGEGSFQKLQVDMFRQLYVEKGYKNITWYTPTFQNWSLMMRNTYQGFEEEKLPTTIFTGADSWEEWTSSAAVYNKNELNAYDHHFYLNTGIDQLINGQVEEQFEQEVTNIRKIDPSDKPVFLRTHTQFESYLANLWCFSLRLWDSSGSFRRVGCISLVIRWIRLW
ncbi:MAG: hypothetical protein RLZ73_1838 [Bacteroidota bacterium]